MLFFFCFTSEKGSSTRNDFALTGQNYFLRVDLFQKGLGGLKSEHEVKKVFSIVKNDCNKIFASLKLSHDILYFSLSCFIS